MNSKILGSRYKIIRALSQGGFGTTSLAEDTQYPDNQQCVVKKLHSSSDNPNFLTIARRLFDKEAKTLAKLGKHPQIPQLLAYFEEEQEFYLVQEYVEGKTLTNELVANQPWSEAQVIDFLQDLLKVVDFVHSEGVIHRDIKPDNLIRRDFDKKLVLVDFGSVKEVIRAQTEMIALTVSVGTKGYMPTEQSRGKPRFASDIYAVGMIAIQALTSHHPLQLPEDDHGETLWQEQANCRPQLAEIISKMVRYHFKDRYQSAQEILTNLSILENNIAEQVDSGITGIITPPTNISNNSQVIDDSAQPTLISNKQTNIWKLLGITLGGLLLIGGSIVGGRYLIEDTANQVPEKELKLAKQKAQAGEYSKAIALAQELPLTSAIQKQIDNWSEQLLNQAEAKYTQNGELEGASYIIQELIPESSPAKNTGEELLAGWKKEYDFNQSILTIATEELQQERWQNAKQEISKIKGQTPFWQEETAKINKAADLGAQSQPGVVDLCSKAVDLCN